MQILILWPIQRIGHALADMQWRDTGDARDILVVAILNDGVLWMGLALRLIRWLEFAHVRCHSSNTGQVGAEISEVSNPMSHLLPYQPKVHQPTPPISNLHRHYHDNQLKICFDSASPLAVMIPKVNTRQQRSFLPPPSLPNQPDLSPVCRFPTYFLILLSTSNWPLASMA